MKTGRLATDRSHGLRSYNEDRRLAADRSHGLRSYNTKSVGPDCGQERWSVQL
jgi:hypothetical protein